MKKWLLVPLAVGLLMPVTAAAQDSRAQAGAQQENQNARKHSTKAVTISGRVSADGQNLVSDEDDIWTISNPAVLAGHEGKQVLVKCQLHTDKNEIHIFFVKAGLPEVKYISSRGDSAFRR